MPGVDGVSGYTENWYMSTADEAKAAAAAAKQAGAESRVTHDEFLTLLTTQLTHQDPMNPIQDQDFLGQMAQLQALDEQIALTKSMTAMRLDSQIGTGAGLIGKYVVGVDDLGGRVEGLVKSVNVKDGDAWLLLDSNTRIRMDSVEEIVNVIHLPSDTSTGGDNFGGFEGLGSLEELMALLEALGSGAGGVTDPDATGGGDTTGGTGGTDETSGTDGSGTTEGTGGTDETTGTDGSGTTDGTDTSEGTGETDTSGA